MLKHFIIKKHKTTWWVCVICECVWVSIRICSEWILIQKIVYQISYEVLDQCSSNDPWSAAKLHLDKFLVASISCHLKDVDRSNNITKTKYYNTRTFTVLPRDHSIYCSLFHKPDNVEYLNNFNMSMVGLVLTSVTSLLLLS